MIGSLMIFGDVPRSDYDQLEISFPTETKTTSLRSFSWLQGGWLVAQDLGIWSITTIILGLAMYFYLDGTICL